MQMLSLKRQREFSSGAMWKVYEVCEPYTIMDCLNVLLEKSTVEILEGEREADHDVGMDSASDHSYYRNFSDFLSSGDYEHYGKNKYNISSYHFHVVYNGQTGSIGFSYRKIMTLRCDSDEIDLCSILNEFAD